LAVRVTCLPGQAPAHVTRCTYVRVSARPAIVARRGDVILSGTGLRYRPHDYRRGGRRRRRERGLGWGPSQNVSASDSSTLPPPYEAPPPSTASPSASSIHPRLPLSLSLGLSPRASRTHTSPVIFSYRRDKIRRACNSRNCSRPSLYPQFRVYSRVHTGGYR